MTNVMKETVSLAPMHSARTPRLYPPVCFRLDDLQQLSDRGCRFPEASCVPLPPQLPRDEGEESAGLSVTIEQGP